MLYLSLFWSFCLVGAFCVGGGYASIPLIQTQVIDIHHWISFSEFMDVVAISQMTPGPIGINAATFVGTKVAGVGGAVAATAGFVTPSLIIMIALAKLLAKYGDMGAIRGVLNGLRPAVVALIASAGVMFLTLSLWNEERLPAVWTDPDLVSTIVLLAALVLIKKKICGVIPGFVKPGYFLLVQMSGARTIKKHLHRRCWKQWPTI